MNKYTAFTAAVSVEAMYLPVQETEAEAGRLLLDQKLRPEARLILKDVPPERQFSPVGRRALKLLRCCSSLTVARWQALVKDECRGRIGRRFLVNAIAEGWLDTVLPDTA